MNESGDPAIRVATTAVGRVRPKWSQRSVSASGNRRVDSLEGRARAATGSREEIEAAGDGDAQPETFRRGSQPASCVH